MREGEIRVWPPCKHTQSPDEGDGQTALDAAKSKVNSSILVPLEPLLQKAISPILVPRAWVLAPRSRGILGMRRERKMQQLGGGAIRDVGWCLGRAQHCPLNSKPFTLSPDLETLRCQISFTRNSGNREFHHDPAQAYSFLTISLDQ